MTTRKGKRESLCSNFVPTTFPLALGHAKHALIWNDDYRQFLIFFGLTFIVNLDYSVPGLVVADEYKNIKSCNPGQDLNPEHIHFEGNVFIHLTTKDQLTGKCADYLPKLIGI